MNISNLTKLKSDEAINKKQVDELLNLCSLAANRAAEKLNASVKCHLTYSKLTGDLKGSLKLQTAKVRYKYATFAINFIKLCKKHPSINTNILDTTMANQTGMVFTFHGSKKSRGIDYAVVATINDPTTLTLIPFKNVNINL